MRILYLLKGKLSEFHGIIQHSRKTEEIRSHLRFIFIPIAWPIFFINILSFQESLYFSRK